MANNCYFEMKIAGKAEAIEEMVRMLKWQDEFKKDGLGRVFSFDCDPSAMEFDARQGSSLVAVKGKGDCAWSIQSAMCPPGHKRTLESESKRLGLTLELFSSEPGDRFQEHYLIDRGEVLESDKVHYEVHCVDNMSEEEIQELCNKQGISRETFDTALDENGDYCIGGFDYFGDYYDLFDYLPLEKEAVFVFDEELCVQDNRHECIDGYLWATDALVGRLKAAVGPVVGQETVESLDNINFYPVYDLKKGSVELIATYYFDYQTEGVITEQHGTIGLPLNDLDSKQLLAAMEAYCERKYGMSCLAFLNEAREAAGLPAFSAVKPSLEAMIYEAEARNTGAPAEKTAVLDAPAR